MATLGNILGQDLVENFSSWDLSEIEEVIAILSVGDAYNLSLAEHLQRQTLHGANILATYLAKMAKCISYLESHLMLLKSQVALQISGEKITTAQRAEAVENDSKVQESLQTLLKTKGIKSLLEKKLEILLRANFHYKEVAQGLRRTVLGHHSVNAEW